MARNTEYPEGMRPTITCSTGAITRWPDAMDAERLEHWCPSIRADSFEVMFYDRWYGQSDIIADRLRALGMRWVAVHAEKTIGPNLIADAPSTFESSLTALAENCRFARQLGAGVLVLHLWGLPDGDAQLDRQLAVLPQLIDIAEAEAVQLGIEALPCTVGTPMTNLERVLETDPRTRFVLDTEFLAIHNELDAALDAGWLWKENRVVHLHIEDFDGMLVDEEEHRRYLHPGEGDIPFNRWLRGLAMREYTGPIALEATVVDAAGEVDLPRLNTSLEQLRELVRDAGDLVDAVPISAGMQGRVDRSALRSLRFISF